MSKLPMPLPLISKDDARAVMRHVPTICCCTCAGANRCHLSNLIAASVLGVSLKRAVRAAIPTRIYRERIIRTGLTAVLADHGLFAPLVDWRLIETGRYAAANPFAASRPLDHVVEAFRTVVENERGQRLREVSEAAGGAGSGLAVRDLSIGELQDLSPAAKRLMRRRAKKGDGGGADALAGLGDDRYAETLSIITRSVADDCLDLARRSDDPNLRMMAWLTDNRPTKSRLLAVPPAWIDQRRPWKVFGLSARVIDDDLVIDGEHFPLESLPRVPADMRGIQLPAVLPSMRVPPPF